MLFTTGLVAIAGIGGKHHHGGRIVVLVVIVAVVVIAVVVLLRRRRDRGQRISRETTATLTSDVSANGETSTARISSLVGRSRGGSHIISERPRQALRRQGCRRRSHLHGQAGPRDRFSRTERRREIHDDAADHGARRPEAARSQSTAATFTTSAGRFARSVRCSKRRRSIPVAPRTLIFGCSPRRTTSPVRASIEVLDLVGLTSVANNWSVASPSGWVSASASPSAARRSGSSALRRAGERPRHRRHPLGPQLLRRLASEGRTVFVSSHLMSEMAMTADQVVVIGQGRLIAEMLGRGVHFPELRSATSGSAPPDSTGFARRSKSPGPRHRRWTARSPFADSTRRRSARSRGAASILLFRARAPVGVARGGVHRVDRRRTRVPRRPSATDEEGTSVSTARRPRPQGRFGRSHRPLRLRWRARNRSGSKLKSVRSTVWTLLVTAIVGVGLGAIVTSAQAARWSTPKPCCTGRPSTRPDRASPDSCSRNSRSACSASLSSSRSTARERSARRSPRARVGRSCSWRRSPLFSAVVLVVGEAVSFVAFLVGQSLLVGQDAYRIALRPSVLRAVISAGLYLSRSGSSRSDLRDIIRHTAAAISTFVGCC